MRIGTLGNALQDAGDAPKLKPILEGLGMSDVEAELAATDVFTAIWWSEAMADYSDGSGEGQIASVCREGSGQRFESGL